MYELLADRAFNVPLLVTPQRLDIVTTVLLQRMGLLTGDMQGMPEIGAEEEARPNMYQVPDTAVYNRDGGYYVDGNVGILNVFGTMVHRGGFMDAASGITSYDAISRRMDRIGNDPQVKVVLGNFDTPGGEVAGAFDIADKWRKLAEAKPVHALISEMAASAGYLIASGSTKIHTTQTGQGGSIGVVMKHIDFSKRNERMGAVSTYIYAGDRKIDGNQDQSLPEEVRLRFEEKIQTIYNMFVNITAKHRLIDAQAIIDTQAEIYMGEAAVEAGLVDTVTTGDELLEMLKQEHSTHRIITKKTTSMETQTMSENNTEKKVVTAAAINVAVAGSAMESADLVAAIEASVEGSSVSVLENIQVAGEAPTAESLQAINAEAVTAERARIATIINSEPAGHRMQAAITLATESSMDADEAIATLSKLPADVKAKGTLETLMETVERVELGADAGGDMTDTQRILASHKAATGKK